MSRLKLTLVLFLCVTVGFASSASAATTLKRLGAHAFYRPAIGSEADLGALVKHRSVELKTGFTQAGYPDLYPAFMAQFPTVKIDAIQVSPGETFPWMLFKRNGTGRVDVVKDLTWGGPAPFDAYRFEITKDGKLYEFVVPLACGNVALRKIAEIPPPPAPVPDPVVVAPPPPRPAPPPAPVVVAPPLPPPARVPAWMEAPPPRAACVPIRASALPPPPPPVVRHWGGPVVDGGFSHQPDPANYVFARVGYELPLVEKLHLLGLVGGFWRVGGTDGDGAFVADLLLDCHWWHRLSLEAGTGYWSGNGGQLDLIAGTGLLLFGQPGGFNGTFILEARSAVDDLDHTSENGRFGLGLRFRF